MWGRRERKAGTGLASSAPRIVSSTFGDALILERVSSSKERAHAAMFSRDRVS